MKTGFLILIGIVLAGSVFFGVVIWRQSVKFEKKALQAKKEKEEYIKELERQQQDRESLSANEDYQPTNDNMEP